MVITTEHLIVVGWALLAILAAWIYFLPVFFARAQRGLIFVLCLFGGWTGVGWVGAMMLAFFDRRDPKPAVHRYQPARREPVL